MAKIRCCNLCPARRMDCHVFGQCIHYMTERAALDEINEEKQRQWRGSYGEADSYTVNRVRKRSKRKQK